MFLLTPKSPWPNITWCIMSFCRRVEDYLNGLLEKMASNKGLDSIDRLTEDFHVYPDFHGNRSPIADPTLKGMVRTRGNKQILPPPPHECF